MFCALEKNNFLDKKNDIEAPKKALIKTINVPNKGPYKKPANKESQDPGNIKTTAIIYIKVKYTIPKPESKYK